MEEEQEEEEDEEEEEEEEEETKGLVSPDAEKYRSILLDKEGEENVVLPI
jgi:hypothetical protein